MLGHVNARTRSRVKGNRLIEMEPDKSPGELCGGDKKYAFTYDYLGRRVEKVVYVWDGIDSWDVDDDQERRFIYHRRQRILTLSGSGADDELFKFVWGPGPGSAGVSPVGRAGALNHLLAIGDDPNSVDYIAFHDGVGNLGQIAKRSDGTLVAKYDFNGRVRAAVIGECEDPDALDDCEQCGPCFFGYGLRSDGSFYPICGCASSHDGPGSGCTGTGCGWGPELGTPGQYGVAELPVDFGIIGKIRCIWICRKCGQAYTCIMKCGTHCSEHGAGFNKCIEECNEKGVMDDHECWVHCSPPGIGNPKGGAGWRKCKNSCINKCSGNTNLGKCGACIKCAIKIAFPY
jgi:hypothetical protein